MMNMSCMHLHFLLVLLLSNVFASSVLMINAFDVGIAGCRPNQIRALVQFKSEFESGGCNNSDYFQGVMCDNTTGVVTKLELPSGCFTGNLKPNSSLFELHHLRHLDLANNNFHPSSLPSGFSNLNRLEVLLLYSNGFIGQIPSSFNNLSQLSHLDLDDNYLTGSIQLVQNYTKLSILKLSYNNFSGNIPSSLLTMPFLAQVVLSGNSLTGPIEVRNSSSSSQLKILHLRDNQFEGQILEPISKLINLIELNLADQNISYPIDLNLFSSINSLAFLDLSGNIISPTSSYVPLSMEVLALMGCGISQFPNFLKGLNSLKRVYIAYNRITGKVPEWFWNLPSLSLAALSYNYFTGFEGSVEVLENSSVKVLELASNRFKGPLPNPPHSLIVLSAWNNSFTGNIPLAVCKQSFLALVDLSYNNFTCPIPGCLSNLQKSLIVLDLRKNNLEGSLPDMCYDDALLQSLDVGYNRLTGNLPRSLLNCSSLKFLSVHNNRIKDTFPFWLKELPYLQALIIRSNIFYGTISPSDQGSLAFPELRILEVAYNNFTGSLPPDYFVNWKASSLQMIENGGIYMGDYTSFPGFYYEDTIDLQYKGLSMKEGKILNSYATIDFSGNGLEGQIPESIGLLRKLIALNLSNNAFTGHIPLSLANLTELESLDLSGNQLSGTIPQGLGSLSFLEYISVAHNQLKGVIPQGTQITGQPKSSFEGNAGLCGLPLEQSCFRTNAPPMQQSEEEKEEEEEEDVLNWKATAIGYGTGLLLGLAIGHVIASFKPEWLVKIICLSKRRNR